MTEKKDYEDKFLSELTEEDKEELAKDLLQVFGGPEQVKEYLDLVNVLLTGKNEISVILHYAAAEYLKRTGKKSAPISEVFAFLGSIPEEDVDKIAAQIVADIERHRAKSQPIKRPEISAIPNAAALHFLVRVLNTIGNGRIPQRSKGNRHESIISSVKGGVAVFTRESEGTTTTVTIKQAEKFMKTSGKAFSKVFAFSLQEMNRQNFPRALSINLQDLVDAGGYSTKSNAARAIKRFYYSQLDIEIGGSIKKGRTTIKEEGGVMFYHWKAAPGHIILYLNEEFNWDFVSSYFSVLPRFAYSLEDNAFMLIWYIFFLARQNADAIRKKGCFSISLEVIREYLGLPAPKQVKNRKYKQYIIDPIEKAIEDIERKIMTIPEAQGGKFTITPYGTDTSNISEYLQGYLEIGLSGAFAETFIELSEDAEKSRKHWQAVKEKEAAKLQAIAERTEKSAEN